MVVQPLRSAQLAKLRCPLGARKAVFRDSLCPGLELEVRASGGRTWYWTRTVAPRHRQQVRLGAYPALGLAQAREAAHRRCAEQTLHLSGAPAGPSPTLRAFVAQRFLPHLRLHKPSWRGDEALLRLHVLPLLGQIPLDQLQPADVDALLQRQLQCGLQANSANKAAVLLRHLLNCAMAWEVIPLRRNPVGRGSLLKCTNQRQRICSPADVQRLLEAVDHSHNRNLGAMVRLLLLTGVRKRELLGMRWGDVDLAQDRWCIPKTKAGGMRTVPLCAAAVALLLGQQPQDPSADQLVFPNPATGRAYTSIYCAWDQARRQAGLANLRVHDLRHTFAAHLVNAGRSLYEVQQLLGHRSSAMTERYAPLNATTLLTAVATAEGLVLPEGAVASDSRQPARLPPPGLPTTGFSD